MLDEVNNGMGANVSASTRNQDFFHATKKTKKQVCSRYRPVYLSSLFFINLNKLLENGPQDIISYCR